ncbi:MAG: hypothetical protein M9962_00745 [Oligoflexia bacterium]|nr:hypothetical protein [Oligoflexia bacterium]
MKDNFLCIFILALLFVSQACFASHRSNTSRYSGYIVIANSNNQSVSLLNPKFEFVRQLLALDGTSTDTPEGITSFDQNNILVAIDGIDRIVKVNLDTLDESIFHMNIGLSGNIRNVTQLRSGDFLVVESNNVERFDNQGNRVGIDWPKPLQSIAGGMDNLKNHDGFVLCSRYSAAKIASYNEDGAMLAFSNSDIPGTKDVTDCAGAEDGRIAAAFSGLKDTIRIYKNASLSEVECDFHNPTIMAGPSAIAFLKSGNLMVADNTNNLFIEIDKSCKLKRRFSSHIHSGVTDLFVIP